MNVIKNQNVTQNLNGVTFAVNSKNRISTIYFDSTGAKIKEIKQWGPEIIQGSLVALNEKNNIICLNRDYYFSIVYENNGELVCGDFKPNGWNEDFVILPGTLRFSNINNTLLGVCRKKIETLDYETVRKIAIELNEITDNHLRTNSGYVTIGENTNFFFDHSHPKVSLKI